MVSWLLKKTQRQLNGRSNSLTTNGIGETRPTCINVHQNEGEKHGMNSPLESRKNQCCWDLGFRLLDSRAMKECISIVLSQQVCGNLFWQS